MDLGLYPLKYKNFNDRQLISTNNQNFLFPSGINRYSIDTHSNISSVSFRENKNFIKTKHNNLSISQTRATQEHYNPQVHISIDSQFHLKKGILFNDLLLYSNAILEFTKAIEINPNNREAYIERAWAYFERNQIDLVLQDYRTLKGLINPLLKVNEFLSFDYSRERESDFNSSLNKIEYFKGYAVGAVEGSVQSIREFIPSTLATLRGIGNCLWASFYNADPLIGIAPELAKVSYICMNDCIEYFKTESSEQIIDDIIPEFREIISKWKQLDDYKKGKMLGFIIGKYGLSIMACTNTMKAIKHFRELRRVNTMLTLEACEISNLNKAKILEEAAKRAAFRQNLFKNGKIKIQWDKQNKHFINAHNYEEGKSIITISREKLEELLEAHITLGEPVGNLSPGCPGYKERINFREVIGIYLERGATSGPPTTNGIVVYAADGIHLIPARS